MENGKLMYIISHIYRHVDWLQLPVALLLFVVFLSVETRVEEPIGQLTLLLLDTPVKEDNPILSR